MKKIVKIVSAILGVSTVAGGVGVAINVNADAREGNISLVEEANNYASIDYSQYCNSTAKAPGRDYNLDLNATAEETLSSFVSQFSDSLNNELIGNDSWMMYTDSTEIPTMLGYISGLGYIKGMREATCGENSDFSSWVYVIENKYFSRIMLASEKMDGYLPSPANSKFYYSSQTWYSNKDKVLLPNFKYDEKKDVICNYTGDSVSKHTVKAVVPSFTETFQLFEGDFIGLEVNETTHLWGISNSNYDRNSFSSKDCTNMLVTNFESFWHISSSASDVYFLNGSLADTQYKKLLIQMFANNKLQACNNFKKDCVQSAKEICSTVGSFYNSNSIQTQFFDFDVEYVSPSYYESNSKRLDDATNYGYYDITKNNYFQIGGKKPSIKIFEYDGYQKSVISFSPSVYDWEVINITE